MCVRMATRIDLDKYACMRAQLYVCIGVCVRWVVGKYTHACLRISIRIPAVTYTSGDKHILCLLDFMHLGIYAYPYCVFVSSLDICRLNNP